MESVSRRNLLLNGAASGLVAAVVASDASAQTYSGAPDPGPHDDAEAAVNPYDWRGLPTGHPSFVCARPVRARGSLLRATPADSTTDSSGMTLVHWRSVARRTSAHSPTGVVHRPTPAVCSAQRAVIARQFACYPKTGSAGVRIDCCRPRRIASGRRCSWPDPR